MNNKVNKINISDKPVQPEQIGNSKSNSNINDIPNTITSENDYNYVGARKIKGSVSQLNRSFEGRESSKERKNHMKNDISKSLIPKLENMFMDDKNYFDQGGNRLAKVTSFDSL